MIKFYCSKCGQKLGVKDTDARSKVQCPKCGTVCEVPRADNRSAGKSSTGSAPKPDHHGSPSKGRAQAIPSRRKDQWFYSLGEKEIGPVSTAMIINMLKKGALGDATEVWREGMSDWQLIRSVPEFQAVAPYDVSPGPRPHKPTNSLEELTDAMSGTPRDRALPGQRPGYADYPAGRARRPRQVYRKRTPKWLIGLVVIGILWGAGVLLRQTGLMSHMGVAIGTTDIRKVIANPEAYAGRTLKSRAMGAWTGDYYEAPGASNAMGLFLAVDKQLEEKAQRILRSVGKYQSVMIKYRIHDKSTLARRRDVRDRKGVLLDVWIP